jgi:cytidine deaminase
VSGAELLERARQARENAYAPYSGFAVGAALLGADGRVYAGCNVENASYSVTCCAERAALFAAVAQGARAFAAIAIAGGPAGQAADEPCPPCGVCRQALAEFCDPEALRVYLAAPGGGVEETTLAALLPRAFAKGNLDA